MEKLVIKAVICNNRWANCPPYRMMAEELAEEAVRAQEAGAAIVHYHCPWDADRKKEAGIAGWREGAKLIREACDAIIEHGSGGNPYHIGPDMRKRDPEHDLSIEAKLGTEMIVNSMGCMDHVGWGGIELGPGFGPDGIFTDESMDRRVQARTRRELMTNVTYDRECGVKPDFETFSVSGPFRNLEWLVKKGAVDKPYTCTMAFGMTGILGDPADIVYLRQRVADMPEKLKDDIHAEVSCYTTGPSQMLMYANAIAMGLNIRVGMEDMPFYWYDTPAKGNAQLVERVARLAKELHRPIADSTEVRKEYGLKPL